MPLLFVSLTVATIAGCGTTAAPDAFRVVGRGRQPGPTVVVDLDGHLVRLMLDTGWTGLAVQPHALPFLRPDGQPKYTSRIWGRPTDQWGLAPVELRLGGRVGTVTGAVRLVEPQWVLDYLHEDGIIGPQALARLASRLHYRPSGDASFSGPPCTPTRNKAFATGTVAGEPVELLVDSGVLRSALFRQGLSDDWFTFPDGPTVEAKRLTEPSVQADFGGGVMNGRRVDGVLGWTSLRDLKWTLNLCEAIFTLGHHPAGAAED